MGRKRGKPKNATSLRIDRSLWTRAKEACRAGRIKGSLSQLVEDLLRKRLGELDQVSEASTKSASRPNIETPSS